MMNRWDNKTVAVLLLLAAAWIAAVIPAMGQTVCENADGKIVTDIYGRLKAEKSLASQVSHINIIALYGAVRLQGWTNYTKDYDRLIDITLNTSCVRLVNTGSFYPTAPPADSQNRAGNGCSTGMKACGDICIPTTDTCSISGG
jgi:hypothetical protein